MKSLLQLLRALFLDLKRMHPEVDGFDRDFKTIEARVEDEGLGFLSVALPTLGKAFDQSLANGRFAHTDGFAKCGSLPKFLSGLTSLVFDTKTGLLRDKPPIDAILSIRQVLYLCRKIYPGDSRNEYLESITRMKFEADDASILPHDEGRLDTLRYVSSFLLQGLDEFQELDGKHGPGAVFEGYSANQKWLATYRGLVDFDHRLMSIGYDLPAMLAEEACPSPESSENDRVTELARLVTVPKTCTSLRTITVEPCLNMFVQQGLNTWLRENISRCRVLKRSLSLNTQKPNQLLAKRASVTGDWCTVDLTSASDLLSLQTVEAVFASKPRFLRRIKACRTPIVNSGGNAITMKKYAGMGNATTFPIQSVVFVAIALCATATSTKELNYEKLRRLSKNVRVFGDDIVIRTEHFPAFADWIKSFGLKINRGKTFSQGNFRESCGVDAFGGIDVTPVYLRHDPGLPVRPSAPSRERGRPRATAGVPSSAVASLVSTANQLWLRCYQAAARYLEEQLERTLRRVLPLVPQSSSALGWHTRQNVRSRSRWNRTLHRFEVRSYVPVAKRQLDVLEGLPALFAFFHKKREDSWFSTMFPILRKEEFEWSTRRFNTVLKLRWVPE